MSKLSIALRMTAVSVFLKLMVYTMNWQFTNYEKAYFFANVFILMSGVFFGIRNFKKQIAKPTSFLEDIKAGMKVAALYAIFMSAFVFFYYKVIDGQYFAAKLAQQLAQIEGGDESNLKRAREMGEVILSPFFQTTATLVGFLLLGSFYAAILAFLMRKLKLR